jgi:hypothetical protein
VSMLSASVRQRHYDGYSSGAGRHDQRDTPEREMAVTDPS